MSVIKNYDRPENATNSSRGNFTSKWDYIRSISSWHFDQFHQSEEQDYKVFMRVDGDWVRDVDKIEYDHKIGISNYVYEGKEGDGLIERDFLAWGYQPGMLQYDRTYAVPDSIRAMVDQLHLKHPDIRIHRQHPGQVSPIHADMFCSHPAIDKDPSLDVREMRRFLIHLTDWDWGHLFCIGNSPWVQWRAGDVAYFESRHVIHCAANAGRKPRVSLIATGWMTDKTRELIEGDFRIVRT